MVVMIAVATGQIEACPLCDSPTAHEVRAGLAGEANGKTLAAIIAPFAVLLAGLRIYSVGRVDFFRFLKK